MKKSIQRGDRVEYYHGYYGGRYINQDGEMEVWDVHEQKYGRVLTVIDNEALVWWYSKADDSFTDPNTMVIHQVHVSWELIRKIHCIN